MSKSIPESAINIGDSEPELYAKIVAEGANDEIVLQMIQLVSNWKADATAAALSAFADRRHQPAAWHAVKQAYFEYFRGLARLWATTAT